MRNYLPFQRGIGIDNAYCPVVNLMNIKGGFHLWWLKWTHKFSLGCEFFLPCGEIYWFVAFWMILARNQRYLRTHPRRAFSFLPRIVTTTKYFHRNPEWLMQPTVSHDKVSTEKLEKKKVVKDTAAFKKNLTFREGLFPFRKNIKKWDLPPARHLDQLFVVRDIIFWDKLSNPTALCME